MKKTPQNINLSSLIALARGELNATDAENLRAALRENDHLQKTYEGICDFLQNENITPEDFVNSALQKSKVFTLQPKPKTYWLPAAVMVMAACIIGFILYVNTPKPHDFDFTDAGLPVNLSIDQDALSSAMNAYKLEDYFTSKQILLAQSEKNPNNDTLIYYLGVIAKEEKNYPAAIDFFKKVPQQSFFYEKAEYQLGLSFWYMNDTEKASNYFKQVAQNKNHLFYKKATNALKAIQ